MLTPEQQEVRRLARDLADQEIAPAAAAWDREGGVDPSVLDRLAGLGFLGMLVPERYGGLGLDVPTYLVALEEIARGDASLALAVAVQNGPVPHLLLEHGSEAQKARWLPRLASGETVAGYALFEAGPGGDSRALGVSASEHDGGWTLTGATRWVANGEAAELVVVFARTDGGGGEPARTAAFLVDAASPGYRAGKREATMGHRAFATAPVHFDGVRVGPDGLLGDPASGLAHARGALDLGRMGIGAQAVGIAQAAMEHATSYACERQQFGRPLARFGAVRGKLASMAARIAASRALVMDVARRWQADNGSDVRLRAARSAMAKLVASETAAWVADQAVHMLGGYGYMREFPVERLMRDAKGTEIFEGTSEIMRLVIGRSMTETRIAGTT